jgi:hypothetical protein
MARLSPLPSPTLQLPAIVAAADERAQKHFLEFFVATIRNAHTRRSYARGVSDFLAWCAERGVVALPQIEPIHVAAWIEELGRELSVPTVKQRLAGYGICSTGWSAVMSCRPIRRSRYGGGL